jgi:uncharacterized protein (AIM24 family)
MAVEAALSEFKETAGSESFQMQGSKMVKVQLSGETIQAKLGSMVAYQGDVKFEHAGSGGLKRMAKKAVTGEGAQLMKISGSGEVFLADLAQEVQLLRLSGEAITVNGANLLAFDADIDWDIKKVEGVSGFMAAASSTPTSPARATSRSSPTARRSCSSSTESRPSRTRRRRSPGRRGSAPRSRPTST